MANGYNILLYYCVTVLNIWWQGFLFFLNTNLKSHTKSFTVQLFFSEPAFKFSFLNLPWHIGVVPDHLPSAPHRLVGSPDSMYPYLHSYDTTEL